MTYPNFCKICGAHGGFHYGGCQGEPDAPVETCEHRWKWHPQPISMLRACGYKCELCDEATLRVPDRALKDQWLVGSVPYENGNRPHYGAVDRIFDTQEEAEAHLLYLRTERRERMQREADEHEEEWERMKANGQDWMSIGNEPVFRWAREQEVEYGIWHRKITPWLRCAALED